MFPELMGLALSLLSLASSPPVSPAEPAPPPTAVDEEERPRLTASASKEERALWNAADEISTRILVERALSNQIQWEVRRKEFLRRLADLAGKTGAAGAKRAAATLRSLRHELEENHAAMIRPWRVDPIRGCRHEMLSLEGALSAEPAQRKASQLAVLREDLEECIARARPMVRALSETNRDLRLLTAEAEAILPPLGPPVPRLTPPQTR